MARIVRFNQIGGPEVLQIENIEVPPPEAGEVRIKVKALGLNRAESMFRLGQYLEMPALAKSLTMRGYLLFEILRDPARLEQAKQFILDALNAGKLKPILDKKTFSLDQIVEAHRYMESNQQFGKIVVTV